MADALFLKLMRAVCVPRIFIPKILAEPLCRWTVWGAMTGSRNAPIGNGPIGRLKMRRHRTRIHPSAHWRVCVCRPVKHRQMTCKIGGHIFSNALAKVTGYCLTVPKSSFTADTRAKISDVYFHAGRDNINDIHARAERLGLPVQNGGVSFGGVVWHFGDRPNCAGRSGMIPQDFTPGQIRSG